MTEMISWTYNVAEISFEPSDTYEYIIHTSLFLRVFLFQNSLTKYELLFLRIHSYEFVFSISAYYDVYLSKTFHIDDTSFSVLHN